MIAAHGRGHGRGLPRSLLSGTLPSHGAVFRTEDVWQRYIQFIETAEFSIRVSPSHSYNACRAGLGWASGWPGRDVYAACSDYVVGFVGGNVW